MKSRSFLLPILCATLVFGCGDSSNPTEERVGPPVNILVLAGSSQEGVAGQPTSVAPSVLITDAENRPVPGVTVTFSIVTGGGSLSSATATTDSRGVATVVWTLGSTFGDKVLRATAGSLGAVTFSAKAIASEAGTLAFNYTDPAGDTAGSTSTTLATAIDLRSLRGDFKRDSLILTLTFASPVAPASASATNSLSGAIEFDIDDNAATGEEPFSNFNGASANLGIEFAVSLFDGSSTSVDFLSVSAPTAVPATFTGNVVTIRIPMRLLGNDDGNFSVVGVFGTSERPTDVAPNTGEITIRRTISGGSLTARNFSHRLNAIRAPMRANWEMTRPVLGR